ncbi:beta-galactosidase [Isoptericola chiayiensis]|uniref:Beta-galactosidase n=1 Tax=Isoptericola chiayiensis TaxID=579446 RepID=A0ABP8XZF1_9MICO|nr:beta-galactosidase [Isoptericola chiayiensis]NOW01254.1 beta-galactosidase [Isoptericola chiayiensis]
MTPYESFRERLPHLVFGGDYNPEQWPRQVWREDVALMREAGVNLVSVGVFSWSSLEPADGDFRFGWLDEVMDLLAEAGIAVDLATPNASPPPWLAEDHPATLMTHRDGMRAGVGLRGHFCPTAPAYVDRSRRLAQRLAERYGGHPALAMWHVGNEYHAQCFCDGCDAAFVTWLRTRYGSLDALNEAWQTAVWSQGYSAWSQVHLPRPTRLGTNPVNPARELDFARFTSDTQLDLFTAERDLLRAVTPQVPVTTNFFGLVPLHDYRRWAREVDVVAFDSYPDPARDGSHVTAAFHGDLMRSLGDGAPWLLLEQAAGAVSQWEVNVTKPPGRMRLDSWQAVGHGADAVMFFQWRAARAGHERFHSAMLPHGGTATRGWREVRELGQELGRARPVVGGRTDAEVAIAFDWESWWALRGPALPVNRDEYQATVLEHYTALWRRNVAVDVVSLDDDLTGYRAVAVPHQYVLSDAQAAALAAFVDGGGHLLVGCFSGIVDAHDRVHLPGYAPGLRPVVGAHVRDLSALPDGVTLGLDVAPGGLLDGAPGGASAARWQDDLVLEGGTAEATYADGDLAGSPAVVSHVRGAGRAVYLGTRLDEAALDHLVGRFVDDAGVRPVADAPNGVEVTERVVSGLRYRFLLNHAAAARSVTLDADGTDLLTGRGFGAGDVLELAPRGVAVLTRPHPHP